MMKNKQIKKMMSLKYDIINKMEGFTLVELIITLTIIIIMAGVVGVSFNDLNDNVRLSTAANRALADVRYAQELAMSHRRAVDVIVNTGADSYEFKWNDTGDYIASPYDAEDFIVTFNQGDYAGVDIISTGIGSGFTFSATGLPSIPSGPRSVMLLNGDVYVSVYESGMTKLEENIGSGGGCGGGGC